MAKSKRNKIPAKVVKAANETHNLNNGRFTPDESAQFWLTGSVQLALAQENPLSACLSFTEALTRSILDSIERKVKQAPKDTATASDYL